MRTRRPGRKPTIALWMLVALADVAVLAAAAGPLLLVVTLASLVAVVAVGRALWPTHRRSTPRRLVTAGRNTPQSKVGRWSA